MMSSSETERRIMWVDTAFKQKMRRVGAAQQWVLTYTEDDAVKPFQITAFEEDLAYLHGKGLDVSAAWEASERPVHFPNSVSIEVEPSQKYGWRIVRGRISQDQIQAAKDAAK